MVVFLVVFVGVSGVVEVSVVVEVSNVSAFVDNAAVVDVTSIAGDAVDVAVVVTGGSDEDGKDNSCRRIRWT